MSVMAWYDWILLVVSIIMILLVVLQNSKEDGSRAFSGEKSDLFQNTKPRGVERIINQTTTILSIVFFVLCMLTSFLPRA